MLIDKFTEKYVVNKETDCWEWIAYRNPRGYGTLRKGLIKVMAHRWAYEYFVGSIPEGLTIDHLCRVRYCVNPKHLEAVTNKENILRGTAPSAINAKKTHCLNNHEFTQANTIIVPSSSSRRYKECGRTQAREWYRNNVSEVNYGN